MWNQLPSSLKEFFSVKHSGLRLASFTCLRDYVIYDAKYEK